MTHLNFGSAEGELVHVHAVALDLKGLVASLARLNEVER